MLFLPRIGDEVLVSFVQGDPDQPVITGSLFNSVNTTPYNLPNNENVSTIRSTGTKAAPDKINEIKFDDTAGAELLNLQASHDMNFTAAHDATFNAANNLSITAGGTLTIQATSQTTFSGPLAGSSLSLQTCSSSNLTLTGNLYLPSTAAGAGGIYFGGAPMIQALAGGDFFAGSGAGNVTMSGGYNTAVGAFALDADSTGANNSAYGYGALGAATTGSENTANGVNALHENVNGNQNTAQGAAVLFWNSNGNANTASGYEAMFGNTSGSNNTANGYKALFSASGNNNIALGYQAGNNLTTGNNDIDIGNAGLASDSGVIRLGTPGTHYTTFIAGTTLLSNNLVMNDQTIQLRGDLNLDAVRSAIMGMTEALLRDQVVAKRSECRADYNSSDLRKVLEVLIPALAEETSQPLKAVNER